MNEFALAPLVSFRHARGRSFRDPTSRNRSSLSLAVPAAPRYLYLLTLDIHGLELDEIDTAIIMVFAKFCGVHVDMDVL